MKKNNIYPFFNTNGLLLIVFLALLIRMAFFISLQPWKNEVVNKTVIVKDATGYHRLASSLLTNKSFKDYDGFRTPGYPVFIALLYGISSSSVWFVLLVQIFLSTSSIILVYKIASTIFSRKISLFAAFLFAIDIHQALYAVTLYSDTLFAFLFLVSIYYLCKSIKENTFSSICLSALFLGIATLTRPISFLLPIVVIFFILVLSNFKLKLKLVYSLLFGVIFLTTISPWILHNYSKYGEANLTSISGYNLLFYNVAYTEVYKTGKTIEEVRKDFYDLAVKQDIDTTNWSSFKNSKIYSKIAQKYIKENFILFCKRNIMGIINMYTGLATKHLALIFHLKSNPLTVDQFGGGGILTQVIDFFQQKTIGEIFISFGVGLYLLINYLFAFLGVFVLTRQKEKFVFLFILIILYFSIITGVVGSVRYRIPFMPFINILCALGLLHFYTKIVGKLRRVKNEI